MSELRSDFLQGMSLAAATVNIVTTDGPAGKAGVTVSAMTSVSADCPRPVLLVCINQASAGARPIIGNGVFVVNVLRESQAGISDAFAGRLGDKGESRFERGNWTAGKTGAPILDDALVSFDCRLLDQHKVGTHHVLFGTVEAVKLSAPGKPLIYANRNYAVPAALGSDPVS